MLGPDDTEDCFAHGASQQKDSKFCRFHPLLLSQVGDCGHLGRFSHWKAVRNLCCLGPEEQGYAEKIYFVRSSILSLLRWFSLWFSLWFTISWQSLLFVLASQGFVVLQFSNSRGNSYAPKAFWQKAARTFEQSESGIIQNQGTVRRGAGECICNGLSIKAIRKLEASLATQFRLKERWLIQDESLIV